MPRTQGALLALSLTLAGAPPAGGLKPYVPESKLYALYKPGDWYVLEERQPESARLLVGAPDSSSLVEFFWVRNDSGRADALEFLAAFREMLGETCASPLLSQAYLSRDSRRATSSVACVYAGRPLTGRFYFESSGSAHFAQGYLSTQETLPARRPLLLNIMASLAVRSQPESPSKPMPPPPPPLPPLVDRRASDGSLSLKTPAEWNFLAGGGKVAASSPDGAAGFIFTAFSGNPLLPNARVEEGVLGVRYMAPRETLSYLLAALGHRHVRILEAAPDRAAAGECLTALQRRCDAQDMLARWTSAQGGEALGALKLINFMPSPMGLWFTIVSGIWAPESDFQNQMPLLEQVASSFSINDQYARRYIQSGLENLRRLQRQTAAAMQDLNRAREQNQRDWEARQDRKDYIDSKWDDYRRGQSYWVSDLEGGKIYQTDSSGTLDTSTGDFYAGKPYTWVDFEGQNPRRPSENMRELSSWEVQHGRKPPN